MTRSLFLLMGLTFLAGMVAIAGAASAQAASCETFFPIDPIGSGIPPEVRRAQCVETDRLTVGRNQFVFVEQVGYDTAGLAARKAQAREAIQRAATLYQSLFTTPDALIVIGYFASLDDRPRDGSRVAGLTVGRGYGCVIQLDDSSRHGGEDSRDTDANQFMRTIAHEYFHCVQAADPTLDNVQLKWRDEGSAEFFAGLAVPDSKPGYAYYADLAQIEERPLYQLRESAYPFFAFLGRERGVAAVVDLLRRASRDHADSGSRQTLSTPAGMDALFHTFAKRYADGELTDESGRPLEMDPRAGAAPLRIEREQVIPVPGVVPFTVKIRPLQLASGMAWGLLRPEDSSVQASWRKETDRDWTALETTIDACPGDITGKLLLTSTQNDSTARTINARVREKPADMRACPCPQGLWHMDVEALRASRFSGIMPGTLTAGSITLNFGPGGVASANFNDITFESAISREGSIKTILRGALHWSYARKPWAAAQAGSPAPTGPTIDAFALERQNTSTSAQWVTQFFSKGRMVGEKPTPFRVDQAGGKHIAAAVCDRTTLTLTGGASSVFGRSSNLPPYFGTFQMRRR